MNDGQIDALFLPIALDAPILQTLLKNPRYSAHELYRGGGCHPYFPVSCSIGIAAGCDRFREEHSGHGHDSHCDPNVVLVRKDIHPALIDLLAQAIVEAHGKPGIFKRPRFPTLTDPEYPVAPSARDFYKNGPSFLNRYLPFWMTSYAQRIIAVLVAVIAIVLPGVQLCSQAVPVVFARSHA